MRMHKRTHDSSRSGAEPLDRSVEPMDFSLVVEMEDRGSDICRFRLPRNPANAPLHRFIGPLCLLRARSDS